MVAGWETDEGKRKKRVRSRRGCERREDWSHEVLVSLALFSTVTLFLCDAYRENDTR